MNNWKNPGDIELASLLQCNDRKLSEIFHFFFKLVVTSANGHHKQEALEFLQLMEEAPELREKIKKIRAASQQELERKISELKNEYHKIQEKNSEIKKSLDELNRENGRFEKEIDEKAKEVTLLTATLEEKQKQIEKMLTGEKARLIKRASQLSPLIEEKNKDYANTSAQWRLKKEQFLDVFLLFGDPKNES